MSLFRLPINTMRGIVSILFRQRISRHPVQPLEYVRERKPHFRVLQDYDHHHHHHHHHQFNRLVTFFYFWPIQQYLWYSSFCLLINVCTCVVVKLYNTLMRYLCVCVYVDEPTALDHPVTTLIFFFLFLRARGVMSLFPKLAE